MRRSRPDDLTGNLDLGGEDFCSWAFVRVEETLKAWCQGRERVAFERTLKLCYRDAFPICELGKNYLVVQLCVRRFKKALGKSIAKTPPAGVLFAD